MLPAAGAWPDSAATSAADDDQAVTPLTSIRQQLRRGPARPEYL
ncbi:hypothetical protein OOK39_45420 [Streptomyces sp. NBC_00264]|nr:MULTISPECIES: hypothetical protein [unclassified Streptomyces]MCX5166278.1 hypothetical protein [Streptomyces sp. NBC_00305]MCX5224795.1 hypothetical protein [Streptomyces sp. NBC_00264]